MDKNTFLAILLSVIVISVGFFVQTTFFMPEEGIPEAAVTEESIVVEEDTSVKDQNAISSEVTTLISEDLEESNYKSEIIEVETDKFIIRFNTDGAVITSMKLKDHMDGDSEVDMILNQETGLGSFGIAFGQNFESYLDETFQYIPDKGNETFSFVRDFRVRESNGSVSEPFRVEKKFIFFPEEYLFEVRINITNSENASLPINSNNQAYTLSVGPQIGPEFTKLDGRNEYRKYYSLSGDKRINHKLKDNFEEVTEQVKWGGIIGKYFTILGLPGSGVSKLAWSNASISGMDESSRMFFVRSEISKAKTEDVYRFYVGPKNIKSLASYNNSMDNPFGFSDMYTGQRPLIPHHGLDGWNLF